MNQNELGTWHSESKKDTLATALKEPPMTDTQPPIPLSADLKPGDILITNYGHRVEFMEYFPGSFLTTTMDSRGNAAWSFNGGNFGSPETDWIVAIERTQATTPTKPDMVNHPPHYTAGGIECIDAIRAALGDEGFIAFCRGNALKYLWRQGKKHDGTVDLEKACWYINKAIQTMKDKP